MIPWTSTLASVILYKTAKLIPDFSGGKRPSDLSQLSIIYTDPSISESVTSCPFFCSLFPWKNEYQQFHKQPVALSAANMYLTAAERIGI